MSPLHLAPPRKPRAVAGHDARCCCDACWPGRLRSVVVGMALVTGRARLAPPSPVVRPKRRIVVAAPERSRPAPIVPPVSAPPLPPPVPVAHAEDNPPTGTGVACRVCAIDDLGDRAQPDLHTRCIERAAALAKKKRQVLLHVRPLTHEQLVAKLAADRAHQAEDVEPGHLDDDIITTD